MFKQIWQSKKIIYRMSIVDLKTVFKSSILSWIWVFLSPMILIGVYLFSFYAAGDSIINIELPYYQYNECVAVANDFQNFTKIGWLIIGVLVWSYISNLLVNGCNSVKNYSWLITKIGTPLCVPPLFVNLSKTYVGFTTIIISWIIYMIIVGVDSNYQNPIISYNFLEFPIVLILSFLFLNFFTLVFSPLAAISKDMFNIIIFVPVFLQWITGVFLPLSKANFDQPIGIIFRINPFNFIVDNIRGSIMGNSFFWNDWVSLTGFFSFFIFFALLAFFIQTKAKRLVVDLV